MGTIFSFFFNFTKLENTSDFTKSGNKKEIKYTAVKNDCASKKENTLILFGTTKLWVPGEFEFYNSDELIGAAEGLKIGKADGSSVTKIKIGNNMFYCNDQVTICPGSVIIHGETPETETNYSDALLYSLD